MVTPWNRTRPPSRLATLAFLVASACDGGGTEPRVASVASVEVSPSEATLSSPGTTGQFTATARDGDGRVLADVSFTWSSSDGAVASVDPDGLATALAPGFTWIVAATPEARDSAAVTVGSPGEVALLPEDWRMPVGGRVRFTATAEGADPSDFTWSVNGIAGGDDVVGTITPTGIYTAPGSVPAGGSVVVRATRTSAPGGLGTSTVTITSSAEPARILFHAWTPRVVSAGSIDSVRYEVGFLGYPELELERPGGDRVALGALRTGVYGLRIATADVLEGYDAGDLHHFAGFLHCESCVRVQRGNVFVNVMDATVPAVSVSRLANDVQASSHVANLRYDPLVVGGGVPPEVLQRFYEEFPDDFDFLAVVAGVSSFANRSYHSVRNDVGGLGLSVFDRGEEYGSAARLKGIVSYPISTFFDAGERAAVHEVGHRWIAFLDHPLLASGRPHWPLSTLARGIMGYSGMGGQGLTFPYEMRQVEGDVYELVCGVGLADEYNDWELYLMGLLPPDSVGSHAVFRDQGMSRECGARGTVDHLSIDEVIALNGARQPAWGNGPTDFRWATLVLSRDRLLSEPEMAFFNHMAARGEATTELHFTSGFSEGTTKPFFLATGRRATLTTRIRP